ncbi:MAG: PaaI family thioesterase [Fimbriimonadaceae bacterium]|nr:PaaI family thioesterase [Alphaproteobacteria bacterium]
MTRYGLVTPEEMMAESGLDFLNGIASGRFPGAPMAQTIPMRPVEASDGEIIFEATPEARFCNPMGTIHGGYTATLLDTVMGCAVHTTLKPGWAYTTMEIKVNYARPMTAETGLIRAIGKVITRGRQSAIAEGRILDRNDKLIAFGTTTCMLFDATKTMNPAESGGNP